MMKLKRALLILFSAVLLSACSQFLGNVAVFREDSASFSDYIAVRGILANYRAILQNSEEVHSSQQDARLIRPTMTSTEYDFYIYGQKGQNDVSSIFGPEKIYLEPSVDGSSGTFQFNVPKGIWTMTLAAVSKGSTFTQDTVKNRQVASTALLWGSCLMDTQNLSMDSNFVLSDAGLTNPGTINIPLTLDGWSFPKTVTAKAGLYYLKTGKAVENTEQTLSITGNDISNYAPQDGGTLLEVKPGSYTFRLTFSANGNDWIWSDQIHIFPGRETDQEIFIPKVINEKPASPEEFAFSLDANPTDQSDYYSGTFTWKVPDSGTTATEYELRLYDEGSGKEYITYTRKNEGSILVRSGSLDSSSTSIQLWLPLGKKLSAQIRAKNRTGTSDESWESTKIKNINLYRITYNLQGGITRTEFFGTGTGNISRNFCYYGSVSNKHHWKVPAPTDINDAESKGFDFWSESGTGTKFDIENDTEYSGFQNVNLYAHYREFIQHPLDGDDVSIKYGTDEAAATILESDTISFAKGGVLKIIILPDGFRYQNKEEEDSVKLKLKKTDGDELDLKDLDFEETLHGYLYSRSTDDLDTGSYEITLIADFYNSETEKVETASRTITLNITE